MKLDTDGVNSLAPSEPVNRLGCKKKKGEE